MAKSSTKKVVIQKLNLIQNVCRLALVFEDAIKNMLDEEEVQKQTWQDLETDWPFADAPNNLVNADGKIIISQDASDESSFDGQDVKQAVDRLTDIYNYLQGTGPTITVPSNPNRDIAALTIDDATRINSTS